MNDLNFTEYISTMYIAALNKVIRHTKLMYQHFSILCVFLVVRLVFIAEHQRQHFYLTVPERVKML